MIIGAFNFFSNRAKLFFQKFTYLKTKQCKHEQEGKSFQTEFIAPVNDKRFCMPDFWKKKRKFSVKSWDKRIIIKNKAEWIIWKDKSWVEEWKLQLEIRKSKINGGWQYIYNKCSLKFRKFTFLLPFWK